MAKGFAYLVVVMDWASRKVLSWRLSNTMSTDACTDALEGLYATLCGRPHLQVAALGANGLAGRCLSLDMRR